MTKSSKHPLGGNAYLSLDDAEEPSDEMATVQSAPTTLSSNRHFILFTLIFLLSLLTSNFFRKHREPKKDSIEVPTSIVLLLRLQLTILAFLPLIAFLITRGVGLGY